MQVSFFVTYSQTSIYLPFLKVNLCDPFREVVDLQSFPPYREDMTVLSLVIEKPVSIGKESSVEVVATGGFTVYFFTLLWKRRLTSFNKLCSTTKR